MQSANKDVLAGRRTCADKGVLAGEGRRTRGDKDVLVASGGHSTSIAHSTTTHYNYKIISKYEK